MTSHFVSLREVFPARAGLKPGGRVFQKFNIEPAEIRIGKAGMTMDRDGKDIGPVAKDVLRPISMVVVDV